MEKKKAYINDLLDNIKRLEERVTASKDTDAIPFSFFREAFDRTENIMRALHELENLQIEEMKNQMEKLVKFLSEAENKASTVAAATLVPGQPVVEEELPAEPAVPAVEVPEEKKEQPEEIPGVQRNKYAEGIVLPEYKKPDVAESPVAIVPEETESQEEVPVITSLNDTIQKEPAVLDLKRGISLNDRFLFQRELFNNDRLEMNNMMIKLNAFDNYPDVEHYLRQHTSWNFEDKTVKEFLAVLQKGFE